jgi:hypothetical protein
MGLFDTSEALAGLDLSGKGLLLLLLGAVVGLMLGAIPAAIYANRARLPFGKRQYRRFDDGSYLLYAPSRDYRDTIVRWEMTVRSGLLESGAAELFTSWEDNGLHSLQYKGGVVVDDRYVIFRLVAVVRRSGKLVRDSRTYKAAAIENDPALVVIEKATGPWSIRPVVVSGFDSQGHCYSSIGIMTAEHAELSEAEVRSLIADTACSLDYGDVRHRVSQRLHAQAITAQRMRSREVQPAEHEEREATPGEVEPLPEVMQARASASV